MSLQLSAAAQMLGGFKPNIPADSDLFDIIYREHFTQMFADPNLAKIFAKDLNAGIRSLQHAGLPFSTERALLATCAQRTLGELLYHPKVWPHVKAQRLTVTARMLRDGKVGNLKRLHRALSRRRDSLRMLRNQLDGSNFYMAAFNRTGLSEEQPSLFDVPQLEDLHRGLSVVAWLESAVQFLDSESADWRAFRTCSVSILRAGWGDYQPRKADGEGPFYWANLPQAAAADRRVGLTFLEAYATSGTHGKRHWGAWH